MISRAHRSELTVIFPHGLLSIELNLSLVAENILGGRKVVVQGSPDYPPGVAVFSFLSPDLRQLLTELAQNRLIIVCSSPSHAWASLGRLESWLLRMEVYELESMV